MRDAGPAPANAAGGPARAADITGLVLAGGRGQRMGGADKGLQAWRGRALVDHVLARLAPQVGELMISANRNVAAYAARGQRVLVDADGDFAGPLAGILAGLRAARTPRLAVAPCDVPGLPEDLVARLAQAVALDPRHTGAVVQRRGADGALRIEPVLCLLSYALADDLARALESGQRKVGQWVAAHAVALPFDRAQDADAFANFNTLADLDR